MNAISNEKAARDRAQSALTAAQSTLDTLSRQGSGASHDQIRQATRARDAAQTELGKAASTLAGKTANQTNSIFG